MSVGGGAAAAPAKIAKPERNGVGTSYVIALLVVMAISAAYVVSNVRRDAQRARLIQPTAAPQPQVYRITFGNGVLTVPQSRSFSYKMEIPANATNVRVAGHFAATGGSGNDIMVSVMTEDAFINWRNHHGYDALWESEKVTVGDINLPLPNGAGAYYLVFNNSFSLLSPKAVQHNIAVTYIAR